LERATRLGLLGKGGGGGSLSKARRRPWGTAGVERARPHEAGKIGTREKSISQVLSGVTTLRTDVWKEEAPRGNGRAKSAAHCPPADSSSTLFGGVVQGAVPGGGGRGRKGRQAIVQKRPDGTPSRAPRSPGAVPLSKAFTSGYRNVTARHGREGLCQIRAVWDWKESVLTEWMGQEKTQDGSRNREGCTAA